MYKDFMFKSTFAALLLVLVVILGSNLKSPLALNLNSVTTQKDSLFEVSDSAKVFAKPDTATMQVGVVKEAKTVEEVQTALNTANNNVIAALMNAGIQEDNIKTVNFSIDPKYLYNRETGEQKIDGYRASSTLEVRTTDFDKINTVIDSATKAGANTVGQVQFIVDNRDMYIAQARKEAIDGAKAKAEAIASESGINLGRLLDVQVMEDGEQPPVQFERSINESMSLDAAFKTTVQPGQNEIMVRVNLYYELQ